MDNAVIFLHKNRKSSILKTEANVTEYSEETEREWMNYQEQLNAYINELHCTGRELAYGG